MTKQSFSQYLAEGTIKLPPSTLKEAMRYAVGAYISALEYYLQMDDGVPPKGYDEAVRALESEFGRLPLNRFTRNQKWVMRRVTFAANELPKQYRRNTPSRKYALDLLFTFGGDGIDAENQGAYTDRAPGQVARIAIDLNSVGSLEKATYNASHIRSQVTRLRGLLNHELQHMVQDVALSKLHPDQLSSQEELARNTADMGDAYFNSTEEFSPSITSSAYEIMAELPDNPTREDVKKAVITAVHPKGGNGSHPFFTSLARTSQPKWKKAVKMLHRLILTELKLV